MKTAAFDIPPADMIDRIWAEVYLPAFEPIRAKAPQRHVMWWEEFLALMQDRAVHKYVTTTDGGDPIGLGCITNDLTAVPLIEPAYYAAQDPELYAQGRIWYVITVCSAPGQRDVYAELLTAMAPLVEDSRGIAALDFSTYNTVHRHLDRAAAVILSRFLGRRITYRVEGEQQYLTYDLTDGQR